MLKIFQKAKNQFIRTSIVLFLILSFLILLYTFYISEINFQGSKHEKYIKYYILSLFLILFFLTSLRFSKKFQEYLVIITFSTIISLYTFEFYYFLKFDYRVTTVKYKKIVKESKIKIYEDFKKMNIQSIPYYRVEKEFLHNNQVIFPVSGVSKIKTIYCNENNKQINYKSDRYGFRNEDKEWDNKKIDVVLIGDSFAQGACVDNKNTLSANMKKKSDLSIINLGISGHGPLKELVVLREYAEFIKPKKIFWFFYEGNDLTKDLEAELSSDFLKKYFHPDFKQDLIKKQKNIDNLLLKDFRKKMLFENQTNDSITKLNNNHVSKFKDFLENTKYLRLWAVRNILKKNISKKKIDPEFKKILKLAKNEVNSWGGKLYFVYLPEKTRYQNTFYREVYSDQFRNKKKILDIAHSLNLQVIDVDDDIFYEIKNPTDLYYLHFNESGYKIISNHLSGYIKNEY